ncbi:hypothetical protein N431DRAFT_477002 [Stipitochalara longipes BDJ]|nr:hypothetical protein N431DRAFT_477002 [Stipitochalara longipes BDJ]
MHTTHLLLPTILALLSSTLALPTNNTLTPSSSSPSFMIDMYNGAMVNDACTGTKVGHVGGQGTIEGCWSTLGLGAVCALSEGRGALDYKICGYTDGHCQSKCIQFQGEGTLIYGVPLQGFTVTDK